MEEERHENHAQRSCASGVREGAEPQGLDIKDYGEAESKKLAQTQATIEALKLAGKINEEQAAAANYFATTRAASLRRSEQPIACRARRAGCS